MSNENSPVPAVSPTSSASLLEELRKEQRAFRFVMTALIVLLVIAAAIAAGGAAFSYFELKDMRASQQLMKRESTANLKVVAGEAGRERETMRSELIAIREENASARRQSDLARRIEQASLNNRIGEYRNSALQIARDHVLGTPLDSATALVVTSVLGAAEEAGSNLLSEDEKLLLNTVKADWEGQSNATRSGFQSMRSDSETSSTRALGAAGLAMLYYRQASGLNLAWEEGCQEVVENIAAAEDMRLEAPSLYLWKGDCLRKKGDTLRAYNAFNAALERLEADLAAGREPPPEQMRLAYHGVGTTLVALAAREEIPSDFNQGDPLSHALELLEHAADIRRQRGATPVGIAYTRENLGFIYILQKDWDGALTHTAEVDRILPLAWNLTVRHIAAMEKADALEAMEDSDPAEIAHYRDIAEEAALVLSLMQYEQFDAPELMRLLHRQYKEDVEALIARLPEKPGTDVVN